MHDLKFIRENPEAFDAGLALRGLPAQSKEILELDKDRRAIQTQMQELQAARNDYSKRIGELKRVGQDTAALMELVGKSKDEAAALEQKEKEVAEKVEALLATIPNIPAADVPNGKDEKDNKEIRKSGEPTRANSSKEHYEIGEALGLMDFDTAAKLSGSRFTLLKGQLAQLERALGNFMLDIHTREHGYTEMSPPLIVREAIMYGTAQLPKFQDDQFEVIGDYRHAEISLDIEEARLEEKFRGYDAIQEINQLILKDIKEPLSQDTDVSWIANTIQKFNSLYDRHSKQNNEDKIKLKDLENRFARLEKEGIGKTYLIPTAEVPLTNTVYDSIVDEGELPKRYVAKTACFRAEAGAAGKDTRGMLRQHQFYKVELVSITTPDKSNEEHERMTASAENILKKLNLPFRTMLLCTGDMGFASRKTYDIEVWLPGQNAYREISSCSNCGDFQARRMKARFRKPGDKATQFLHTLNGSGVAIGRCLIAILENNQQTDGSVLIPEALRSYMGGLERIAPVKA